jgi:hypothetical protein
MSGYDDGKIHNKKNVDKLSGITRNIKGKTYDVFDIENLKAGNEQMEKFIALQEKRLKLGKQLDEQEKSRLEQTKKTLKSNNDVINSWGRYVRSSFANRTDMKGEIASIINSAKEEKKTPKSITELFVNQLNAKQTKLAEDAYAAAVKSVGDKYKAKHADMSDSSVISAMNDEIREKTLKSVSESVSKFETGAATIQAAGDAFKSVINSIIQVWVNVAKTGISNQADAYQTTFEGISVRTGTTRGSYYSSQNQANNYLSSAGLNDNIAMSDVQKMWSSMATNGINVNLNDDEKRAELIGTSIDNVLTQSIVPYLDTTTAQWDQLLNAQPELQKNIRGINRLNNEIVGNNYATADILQTILDDLQPISDSALNDLAMSATGASAFINSLMAENSDMTYDTAKSIWEEYYKEQNYGSEIMRSGTTAEKMALSNALTSGINIYDSSDTGKALGNIAGTYATAANWGTGYGSTTSGIVQSALNSSLGIDSSFAMWATTHSNYGELIETAVKNSEEAMNSMEEYADIVTDEYTSGTNQTNQTLQNITVENFMTKLAIVDEWLGNWTNVIVTAIKGIKTILVTYIGGKLLTGLFGSGGGASALLTKAFSTGGTGLLATGGGILLGVAAGTMISNAIVSGITDYANGIKSDMQSAAAEAASDDSSASFGNTNVETTRQFEERMANYGASWGDTIANGNNKGGLFGIGYLGIGDSYAAKANQSYKAQNWTQYDIYQPLKQGIADYSNSVDAGQRMAIALAYALALDEVGMLNKGIMKSIFGSDISSEEDIYDMMAALYYNYGYDHNMVDSWASIFAQNDIYPRSTTGKVWDGNIEDQEQKIINSLYSSSDETAEYIDGYHKTLAQQRSHRQGLDEVPYDGYVATLHEGEAVLTASTANELRNLLDEYRTTTTQTVNFETIIQTQTTDLINKMSEIIDVIQNNATLTTSSTSAAKMLLANSMATLTSTKSFK